MTKINVPGFGLVDIDANKINGEPLEFGNEKQARLLKLIAEIDAAIEGEPTIIMVSRHEVVTYEGECQNCGMESEDESEEEATDVLTTDYKGITICKFCYHRIAS